VPSPSAAFTSLVPANSTAPKSADGPQSPAARRQTDWARTNCDVGTRYLRGEVDEAENAEMNLGRKEYCYHEENHKIGIGKTH
jgi:hypothetical protein